MCVYMCVYVHVCMFAVVFTGGTLYSRIANLFRPIYHYKPETLSTLLGECTCVCLLEKCLGLLVVCVLVCASVTRRLSSVFGLAGSSSLTFISNKFFFEL